ncbi:TfoX domain containing protein [Duganella sp. FT135W]|uniref:TfoX domain containing protein n=1 Tax=Duganella flavida TaxID=2692175 RepID=A0A6L8KEA8_9BURK|nr:TfoX/Sxy family protein [Duganella flavida]MYM24104.1 TfoX domain containing protein [Duganella flavida]
MAANAEFVSYIKEQLAPLGFLSSGSFFGGQAINYHGHQFAWVIGSTLYLRVNDITRPDFEAAGAQPFKYNTKKGKITVRKFYTAPEFLLDDPEQLLSWSRRAIEATSES